MDSYLYKKGGGIMTTLVSVYENDLLVTGTSVTEVDQFLKDTCMVEVKDLGEVTKFRVRDDIKDGYHLE